MTTYLSILRLFAEVNGVGVEGLTNLRAYCFFSELRAFNKLLRGFDCRVGTFTFACGGKAGFNFGFVLIRYGGYYVYGLLTADDGVRHLWSESLNRKGVFFTIEANCYRFGVYGLFLP